MTDTSARIIEEEIRFWLRCGASVNNMGRCFQEHGEQWADTIAALIDRAERAEARDGP